MVPQTSDRDNLSLLFSALAHPLRREIISTLRDGKASVKEIVSNATQYSISMPAFTRHLKILEDVGLIDRSQEAQLRLSELNPRPLKEVSDWLDDYRDLWEQRFDQLERYIDETNKRKK